MEGGVSRFRSMLREVYADFGFLDFLAGFSTRPERLPCGIMDAWEAAESLVEAAAAQSRPGGAS